jgi:hypothetical protein
MLSIIIVNWNTVEMLKACLLSLQSFPPECPVEVLVVDNASTDGSPEMVKADFPNVILLEPGKNTGYAEGNNLAAKAARGDYLLLLNPDTEVFPTSLPLSIGWLEANPKFAGICARLIGPDGETQSSVRGFPSILGIIGDISGLGSKLGGKWDSYRLSKFDYKKEQLAPQPMGTFLLFRRSALEQIGRIDQILDPSFPIFFNDVDLSYRLHLAALETKYVPSIHVKHHGGMSTKQVRKPMIWESHRSLIRFLKKHRIVHPVLLPLLAWIVYLGAFVRAKGYSRGF